MINLFRQVSNSVLRRALTGATIGASVGAMFGAIRGAVQHGSFSGVVRGAAEGAVLGAIAGGLQLQHYRPDMLDRTSRFTPFIAPGMLASMAVSQYLLEMRPLRNWFDLFVVAAPAAAVYLHSCAQRPEATTANQTAGTTHTPS